MLGAREQTPAPARKGTRQPAASSRARKKLLVPLPSLAGSSVNLSRVTVASRTSTGQVHLLDDKAQGYSGTQGVSQDTPMSHHVGDDGATWTRPLSPSPHPSGGLRLPGVGCKAPSTGYKTAA